MEFSILQTMIFQLDSTWFLWKKSGAPNCNKSNAFEPLVGWLTQPNGLKRFVCFVLTCETNLPLSQGDPLKKHEASWIWCHVVVTSKSKCGHSRGNYPFCSTQVFEEHLSSWWRGFLQLDCHTLAKSQGILPLCCQRRIFVHQWCRQQTFSSRFSRWRRSSCDLGLSEDGSSWKLGLKIDLMLEDLEAMETSHLSKKPFFLKPWVSCRMAKIFRCKFTGAINYGTWRQQIHQLDRKGGCFKPNLF